jgi:glycerate 2-kinase
MNILIAPNSMKGSLDAAQFAEITAAAFRKISPVFTVRTVPVADGGDYTAGILFKGIKCP